MPAPEFYDKTYLDSLETRVAALEAAKATPTFEPRVATLENAITKLDAALESTAPIPASTPKTK
jgi:hypothetical protein